MKNALCGIAMGVGMAVLALAAACKGSGAGPGGDAGNGGRPTVSAFTADPAALPAGGGRVTLSWTVSGADTVTIDHGVGTVTGTSVAADVTATTIFTLMASNGAGTTSRSAVVMVGASAAGPLILSFTAAPASVPAGGGQTTLRWQVANADSLTIDQGVGAVTGDSRQVTVSATTIYTLTATNADGSSTATTAVSVGKNPSSRGGRFSAMVAPTDGESFIAPAALRLIAAGRDPNIDTNNPRDGLGGNASKVQFFVDEEVVLEVDGGNAEYWIFKGFSSGTPAGQHRVWARSIFVSPADVLDSEPVLITVSEPPAYAQTVNLTADMALPAGGIELAGTAGGRIRLNGNGHRITSGGGATGNLTLKHVDVFDLGSRSDPGQSGMDVTTRGTVTIEDSTFDSSNTLRIAQEGAATASVRRNLFRSNMRMPIGQNPAPGVEQPSYPVVRFGGGTGATGAKVFAGNNVGAGWVEIAARNWLVGGDSDADSNVLIGARVGIYVDPSGGAQIRRNYSHHDYYGGWSQGSNFELGGSAMVTAEHNVIYGSSWPVRGVGGEFRYNMVCDAGHEWLWADSDGGSIHHNLFLGGDADIGGIWILSDPQNVRIFNNTFDGQMRDEIVTAIKADDGSATLTSNIFVNVTNAPAVSLEGGTLTTDYNLFSNPHTTNYSDGRRPAHDVGGGARSDPLLTDPATVPFDLDEVGIWKRSLTVRDVLARYRMRYTPRAGSPAIDAGDPAGGAGNDVGAIGAGDTNADDRFGVF